MGWYRTCSICKTEAKHGLGCDCGNNADRDIANKMVGCKILETHWIDSYKHTLGESIVQKLQKDSGDIFYVLIDLSSVSREYEPDRRVKEITEQKATKIISS